MRAGLLYIAACGDYCYGTNRERETRLRAMKNWTIKIPCTFNHLITPRDFLCLLQRTFPPWIWETSLRRFGKAITPVTSTITRRTLGIRTTRNIITGFYTFLSNFHFKSDQKGMVEVLMQWRLLREILQSWNFKTVDNNVGHEKVNSDF